MKATMASRIALGVGMALAAGAFHSNGAAAGPIDNRVNTGPSSSESPYLLPTASNLKVTSLLTTGDSVNNKADGTPYRMVGIPDGLGAFDNGDGTISVLMNHELGATSGIVRDHGTVGAFISKWTINKNTLAVLKGEDLMKTVFTADASGNYSNAVLPTAFGRFCSADLPAVNAFFNPATGLGTQSRIFLSGEESGNFPGRAVAAVATGADAGKAFDLPLLGRLSHENSLANPGTGDKTVVATNDDGTTGGVFIYVGNKKNTGSEIDKAGLTNGKLFAVSVNGVADDSRTSTIGAGTSFKLTQMFDTTGGYAAGNGALQSTFATAKTGGNATSFLRPEDGAWDPSNPNVYYFVTTDRYDQVKDLSGSQVGRSRLYRLTFSDINNPEAGGKIDTLVDGTGPAQMFDNISVDKDGIITLLEDVGGNAHAGKVWQFNTKTGQLKQIFTHDPSRFGDLVQGIYQPYDIFNNSGKITINAGLTLPSGKFNNDEESSGVIDVTDLFKDADWYRDGQKVSLIDVQAHFRSTDPELVEGGQLLLLVDVPEPATLAILGVGLLGVAALRRRYKA